MYTANALIHLTCDSSPLINAVTGTLSTVTGPGFTTAAGIIDGAIQLNDQTYATIAGVTNPTAAMTISFWLKPSFRGVVTSPNFATQGLREPLFSKATSTYTSGTTNTAFTSGSTTYALYEESRVDGDKSLKIVIGSATIATPAYTAGEFHHFWITYSSGTVRCWIDLVEQTLTVSGSIPVSLPASSANFAINKDAPGQSYRVARNTGVLDDVLVLKTANVLESDIAEAANKGALWVADATLAASDEVSQAIIFNDISTVKINGVFANRGSLYVARSDGKLLAGRRLLWQSRRDFNKISEINGLVRHKKTDDASATVSAGSLRVINETIRI
jgi:hypothetical protein